MKLTMRPLKRTQNSTALSATLSIAALLSFALPSPSWARGGADVGNGGDAYSSEFAAIGQSLVEHWDELGLAEGFQITREKFAEATRKAQVHSVSDSLFVGQFEVDAKNYPFCEAPESGSPSITGAAKNGEIRTESDAVPCGTILLNRSHWDALKSNRLRKAALVLHEYLGVLGMNGQRFDDFYEVTSKAFERLRDVLAKQRRVEVNFSCWVETWDAKKNQISIIESLDTYGDIYPRKRISVSTNGRTADFWISLQKLEGDLLAPTLMDRLSYALYRAIPMQLPSDSQLLASGPFEFKKNGKRSLRISSSPEIQLTCFRTLDQITGDPEGN